MRDCFYLLRFVVALWPALVLMNSQAAEPTQAAGLIATGWQYYRLGEFSVAAKHFERAVAQAGADATGRAPGLYGLAVTWDLRRPGEDRDKARRWYEEVVATAPQSEWAPWSALALARMNATLPPGSEPPLAELLAAYQRVIDQYPDHPAGEEAFLFRQSARLTQLEPDAAEVLAELDRFLEARPRSAYRASAYGLVVYACELLGLGERRLAALIQQWQAAEPDPRNPIRDLSWTYWQIATVAEFEVGDFAVAREYYQRFIAEYPTEQKAFLAKQELRRMTELEKEIRGAR